MHIMVSELVDIQVPVIMRCSVSRQAAAPIDFMLGNPGKPPVKSIPIIRIRVDYSFDNLVKDDDR